MVEIQDVTKAFGEKKALDKVSFSIPTGAVLGLAGSNGAGKSTLLRLLAGVYQPDSGQVLIDGMAPYDNYKVRESCVYLPDTPQFFFGATPREMAAYYRQIYPKWDDTYYHACLNAFDLEPKTKFLKLSKGKQRQAAVALAFPAMPRLLLLDEVFDGLDPVMRKLLKDMLIQFSGSNQATALLASHNLREMDGLCDAVCLLHQGKLVFMKNVKEMKERYCRVQVLFQNEDDFENCMSSPFRQVNRQGKLVEFVTEENTQALHQAILAKKPLSFETFPLTLEEIILYHMEVLGYDGKKSIF